MDPLHEGEIRRLQRMEGYLVLLVSMLGLFCLASVVFVETTMVRQRTEFVPLSLNSRQVAKYGGDPIAIELPGIRLDLIADMIRDQEPNADVAARFAAVQENLLTPVAWVITPTPTRTPTLTRTATPTYTFTPTRTPAPTDPWILFGSARVGCNTEVRFDPVTAIKFKFQMLTGGGANNHISFYCCRSNGAAFLVNGVWLHVTNRSDVLNVGEWRETGEFPATLVSRALFNVGCNDKEQMDVQLNYLPVPIPSIATPPWLPPAIVTPTPTATPTVGAR